MDKFVMDDAVADRDAKLAKIVAMGTATVEEASRALEGNGGDVDRAIAQLDPESTLKKPSRFCQPAGDDDGTNAGIGR